MLGVGEGVGQVDGDVGLVPALIGGVEGLVEAEVLGVKFDGFVDVSAFVGDDDARRGRPGAPSAAQ